MFANFPKQIYITISQDNDECSLCNRGFYTYDEAWAYNQKMEKETGCLFKTIKIDINQREEKDIEDQIFNVISS